MPLKWLRSPQRQQLFIQYELFKVRFHLGSLVIPAVVIYERWINIWLSFLLKAAVVVTAIATMIQWFLPHAEGLVLRFQGLVSLISFQDTSNLR